MEKRTELSTSLKAFWYLLPLVPILGAAAVGGAVSRSVPGKYEVIVFFISTMAAIAASSLFLGKKLLWTISPVNQPNTAFGRYFHAAPIPSLNNLLCRYTFLGGLGLILLLFSFIAIGIYPIAMVMLTLRSILWLPFVPFSRSIRIEFVKSFFLPIAVYGLIKGVFLVLMIALFFLDVIRLITPGILWEFVDMAPGILNTHPYFTVPDALLGLGAVIIVPVLIMRDYFWRTRQLQQLENLATSNAASAAVGLAELKGRAVPVEETAGPILSVRGSYFAIASSANANESDEVRKPFYLEDDSGRILVDPADAKVWEGLGSALEHLKGVREMALRKRTKIIDRNDSVLAELQSGDHVYVIGQVEQRADQPPDAADQPQLVIRPRQQQGFRDALTKTLSGTRDINDVFFLTDGDELSARDVLRDNRRTSLILGLIWFLLSAIVFVNGAVWASVHWAEVMDFVNVSAVHLSELFREVCGNMSR